MKKGVLLKKQLQQFYRVLSIRVFVYFNAKMKWWNILLDYLNGTNCIHCCFDHLKKTVHYLIFYDVTYLQKLLSCIPSLCLNNLFYLLHTSINFHEENTAFFCWMSYRNKASHLEIVTLLLKKIRWVWSMKYEVFVSVFFIWGKGTFLWKITAASHFSFFDRKDICWIIS